MKKYLFLFILIAVFSCNKEDDYDLHKYPGLPDATRSGQNTMGCLINGKPWVAKVDGFVFIPALNKVYAEYGEIRPNISEEWDKYTLFVSFHKSTGLNEKKARYDTSQFFTILLQPIEKEGLVEFPNLKQFKFNYSSDAEGELSKWYELDTLASPILNILKLDTTKNIISGVLDLKMRERDDKNDTIRISNGRFDINYTPR